MRDHPSFHNPGEPFCKILDREVAFGRLVALQLPAGVAPVPDPILAGLEAQERTHALALRGRRQIEWVGGRLALHLAAGRPLGPVLVGARGEPLLPAGVSASISHKRRIAAALVGREGAGTVGLDIEEREPPRLAIARRVLVEEEREAVEGLPEAARWPAVLRRFATKEAIYKAIHPHVGRFVGFDEAVVGDDLSVRLALRGGEGPFSLDVDIRVEGPHLLAMVLARR